VAHALFNDSAAFRDPKPRLELDLVSATPAPGAPIRPEDVLIHLTPDHGPSAHVFKESPGSLSLSGILRLLFDVEAGEAALSVAAGDEDLDEGQLPDDRRTEGNGNDASGKKGNAESAGIPARMRERLASQITAFLNGLRSEAFAERCTATQMVQAVSFPLAVALRGRRRGWLDASLAETWALDIFAILFRGDGHDDGLLQTVERRYERDEARTTFDEVVGDGTLWVVLVATLGNANWRGIGTEIEKAVAIRDVFTAPQLLATATPERIAALLGSSAIEAARTQVVEIAPVVTRLLDQIETRLQPIWEQEMRVQGAQHVDIRAGDLMWRESVGWATCLADRSSTADTTLQVRLNGRDRNVRTGFYVDVTEVSRRNPDLSIPIAELLKKIRGPDTRSDVR
jgi:hypothetical protein